jgi:hypothetical protein
MTGAPYPLPFLVAGTGLLSFPLSDGASVTWFGWLQVPRAHALLT